MAEFGQYLIRFTISFVGVLHLLHRAHLIFEMVALLKIFK